MSKNVVNYLERPLVHGDDGDIADKELSSHTMMIMLLIKMLTPLLML